ncbi:hypothetical protein Lfu02_41300 [Longispora fulva]|nr:hypothetical protein Lfu02_41300 [Longispora fulva]
MAAIAIAYGAHVFYGLPLGRLVQEFDRTVSALAKLGRCPVGFALTVVIIVVWQRALGAVIGSPRSAAVVRRCTR